MKQKKQGRHNSNNSLSLLALFFWGCTGSQGVKFGSDELALKLYTIRFEKPLSAKILTQSVSGFDGQILLNIKDTVYFNFGYDINNLAEKDPAVVYYPYDTAMLRSNLDTTIVNPSEIVYTKKSNLDIDELRKQNVFFVQIDKYKAKVTLPREANNGGITGVYVDSLTTNEGGRLKFNLFVKNIDSIGSQNLLKAIRTIRFIE